MSFCGAYLKLNTLNATQIENRSLFLYSGKDLDQYLNYVFIYQLHKHT